tara:strand:- start:95 stop:832 length:738 start_codon:yes stop_codon:yes gene_type:complete
VRVYKVNGIEHTVYEYEDPIPQGINVVPNWRDGRAGDWVKADDDCIIQILRKGKMHRNYGKVHEYIGTCTGTFPVYSHQKMDTNRRPNIYSFSGYKSAEEAAAERTKLTKHERLFVMYTTSGMQPREAYMKAFPTNNPHYAEHKSASLTKTERISKAMKKELEPVLEELGITEKAILDGINQEAKSADKADTRLKALFKLADILDLEDKSSTKVTQVTGNMFTGFTNDMIEKAERPKELEVPDVK